MTTTTKTSNKDLAYLGLYMAVALIIGLLVPSVPEWDHTIRLSIIFVAMWPWMVLTYHLSWWHVGLRVLGAIAVITAMNWMFWLK